eukprot:3575463-Rhodomonas_salina.1
MQRRAVCKQSTSAWRRSAPSFGDAGGRGGGPAARGEALGEARLLVGAVRALLQVLRNLRVRPERARDLRPRLHALGQ